MYDKWFARSITIWGVFVTSMAAGVPAINPLLVLIGMPEIDPAWVQSLDEGVRAFLSGTMTIVGTAMIVWGRWRAVEPLNLMRKKK